MFAIRGLLALKHKYEILNYRGIRWHSLNLIRIYGCAEAPSGVAWPHHVFKIEMLREQEIAMRPIRISYAYRSTCSFCSTVLLIPLDIPDSNDRLVKTKCQ